MIGQNKTSFEAALTLTECETGYSAKVPETWSQGRATYGGLVAGLLARALARVVPSDRQLRSALIDFMAPVAPGAVLLETKLLRAGRTLSHAEARLVQNGEVAALFVGVYATPRRTQLKLPALLAPSAGAPSELLRVPYVEGASPRFTQHFEFRVPPGRQLFRGSPKARLGGYVRHVQGGPVDAAGVLGLIDAWPPAFMPSLTRPAVASSVTWMVDIMAELPALGSQSEAFFRYEAEAVAARDGCASCEARLWSESGELIAASRQLVAEFS